MQAAHVRYDFGRLHGAGQHQLPRRDSKGMFLVFFVLPCLEYVNRRDIRWGYAEFRIGAIRSVTVAGTGDNCRRYEPA